MSTMKEYDSIYLDSPFCLSNVKLLFEAVVTVSSTFQDIGLTTRFSKHVLSLLSGSVALLGEMKLNASIHNDAKDF